LTAIEHQWWFVSLRNPAIISMPLSFAVAILLSLVTREKNADLAFDEMQQRILLGPVQPTTSEPARAKSAA
ncbi:cation acetate symporter, partial [Pandoraea nosoerga]|nr:cation acetate symporter [Pandoraea nosoerga]